tara:strand:+ start:148 stop:483 length:336 start_codon:yes stop_codon:yes gene_type:complete
MKYIKNDTEKEHLKINKYKIFIFILAFLIIIKINYFGSKKTTQKLVLHLGKHCIHIHHWFSFLFLIFFMYFIRYCKYLYFESLIIIFSAFILEGFLFKDFYKFFYKNCINI